MANEEIVNLAAEAMCARHIAPVRIADHPDPRMAIAACFDCQVRAATMVPVIEPLVREQIAKDIESHYLGPDSGRSPLDGRDAPDAHLRNAYDEGLEVSVRIARGDQHE